MSDSTSNHLDRIHAMKKHLEESHLLGFSIEVCYGMHVLATVNKELFEQAQALMFITGYPFNIGVPMPTFHMYYFIAPLPK